MLVLWNLYKLTIRQLLRQANIWYINLFAFISIEISPSFAELFTFGRTEVAVIDAVQACVFLNVLVFALLGSYTLFYLEFKRKVAFNLFSRPVEVSAFMFAKFLALLTFLLLACLFQAVLILKHAYLLNWSYNGVYLALCSLWSVFWQGVIFLSISVTFAVIFGDIIGIFGAIFLLFLGYTIPTQVLAYTCFLIPAIPWYDLSLAVYGKELLSLTYMLFLSLYACSYSSFIIYLAIIYVKLKKF